MPLLISSTTFVFLSTNIEQNKLEFDLRSSENFGIFRNNILELIRPKPNSFFNCCNLKGIMQISRLRLELIQLSDHKFNFNFQIFLNLLSSWGSSVEINSDFLLHCPIFNDRKHVFLNIDFKILESIDSTVLYLMIGDMHS